MNDDELKKRFGELKRHDAKRAPTFEATIAKRRQSSGGRVRLLFAVVPIVAAAAVVLLWCGSSMNKVSAPAPTAVAHTPRIRVTAQTATPTDFLLDTTATMAAVRLDTSSGLLP